MPLHPVIRALTLAKVAFREKLVEAEIAELNKVMAIIAADPQKYGREMSNDVLQSIRAHLLTQDKARGIDLSPEVSAKYVQSRLQVFGSAIPLDAFKDADELASALIASAAGIPPLAFAEHMIDSYSQLKSALG